MGSITKGAQGPTKVGTVSAKREKFRPYVLGIAQLPGVQAAMISEWGHFDVIITNGAIVRLAITEIEGDYFHGGVYVFSDFRLIVEAECAITSGRPAFVTALLAAAIADTLTRPAVLR